MKLHEKTSRSLVKTITYRLTIIVSQSIIVQFITRDIVTTVSIVSISNIIATILYFLHERIWNSIHWGKIIKK